MSIKTVTLEIVGSYNYTVVKRFMLRLFKPSELLWYDKEARTYLVDITWYTENDDKVYIQFMKCRVVKAKVYKIRSLDINTIAEIKQKGK